MTGTDPGTIYSDDEIDCFSEEDDETELAKQEMILPPPEESFFYDLFSAPDTNKIEKVEPNPTSISKYMDKKVAYDIDNAIKRVRKEELLHIDDDDELAGLRDAKTIERELKMKLDKDLKLREKDAKKKEKKKTRLKEEADEKLEKEKLKMSFEDAPAAPLGLTFLEMNLSTPVLKAISTLGYEHPTPIQGATIPVALKGRDICGCAATGTGKTAAFMLPIIQRLIFKPPQDVTTRVLVLVPTRELGVQVYEVANALSQYCNIDISLAVGGLNIKTQVRELCENPDIIIATPGRLIDHIHNTPSFSLKEIEILILDEADRMLDEFFEEQLTEIVRQCCATRQTMLFSATMTDKVKDLAAVSLKNPVRVFVNNNTDVAYNLRQEFVRLHTQSTKDRLAVLAYLLFYHFKEQCMVFIPKKYQCHNMHIVFGLLGIKCGELHGNMKQNARFAALQNFKDKNIDVLFATDVAARGLDIKGVKTVINYTVPSSYEKYVHRVGRTARAGFSGRSVTISFDSGEDYNMLRRIQKNSLSAVYERIVSKKTIQKFAKKIDAIQGAVTKVVSLEKAEKEVNGMALSLEKMESQLKVPAENGSKRRVKKFNFKTPKDARSEMDRLKLVIAGKAPLRPYQKKKKSGSEWKPGPKRERPQEPEAENGAQKKRKREEGPTTQHEKPQMKPGQSWWKNVENKPVEFKGSRRGKSKDSNFERDLTRTSKKTIKQLRSGPSYKEREGAAQKKSFRK